MNQTVEQYLEWDPMEQVLQHPDGFKVEEVTACCYECGSPTEDVRGEVSFHDKCIDVKAAGRCESCSNLVTFIHLRFYEDRMLHWNDEGITTYHYNRSWWARLSPSTKTVIVGLTMMWGLIYGISMVRSIVGPEVMAVALTLILCVFFFLEVIGKRQAIVPDALRFPFLVSIGVPLFTSILLALQ